MITVKELTKVYGSQKAIDSIDFQIGAGEIVGFLGPNGAGKTTTMKIITCFMPPSSGTVEVDQLNIHEHSLEIRKRIGYLPEHNPLYLDMYVHEYLKFVGRLYHLPGSALARRIPEVIDMTGLGREQHKKIGMLSKGYRQRVGLSQALIHDPDILILDEPTTGLDPNQIVEIRSLIKEIGKSKTIIFSTHILPEVEAIANRVIIINRGKIVADETLSELRHGSASENVLHIAFDKPGFAAEPVKALNEAVRVRQEGASGKEFTFYSPAELDLRRVIMEQSIAQGNPIAALQKKEKNLEEVFRSLTNG
ncbi:MAG: gliding motility-associated ABC transporter ATP-binding subunit GldA [Bacteroidetes bacterium]|nr:gliding motility-associated ABC transporter ATP-binding subunit GldA [Bacteroidota bacterium]MBL0016327.1 gliding motility-associated ABC transporter ATP-binding subunit GldA [Bacteroidota bacterium]MBP6638657.1 gliding motility-associated ABC transporter ATP-binding subunit GldA [Bacteroidia bacterium]